MDIIRTNKQFNKYSHKAKSFLCKKLNIKADSTHDYSFSESSITLEQ